MPVNVIKTYAKKTGKSEGELERLWVRAKEAAKEQGRDEDYAYIMGIFKKMAGISESVLVICGDKLLF